MYDPVKENTSKTHMKAT